MFSLGHLQILVFLLCRDWPNPVLLKPLDEDMLSLNLPVWNPKVHTNICTYYCLYTSLPERNSACNNWPRLETPRPIMMTPVLELTSILLFLHPLPGESGRSFPFNAHHHPSLPSTKLYFQRHLFQSDHSDEGIQER